MSFGQDVSRAIPPGFVGVWGLGGHGEEAQEGAGENKVGKPGVLSSSDIDERWCEQREQVILEGFCRWKIM